MAQRTETLRTVRYVFRLLAIAFAVNLVWEMAQMPLYRDMPFDSLKAWLFCVRASVGDAVIIVGIWAGGRVLFGTTRWTTPVAALPLLLLVVVGAAIAIGIEHVSIAAGRWEYSALMPVVPLIETGLSPLIQLIILPGISIHATSHSLRDA